MYIPRFKRLQLGRFFSTISFIFLTYICGSKCNTFNFKKTRRYSLLHRRFTRSCRGLQPTAKCYSPTGFLPLLAKKYFFLSQFSLIFSICIGIGIGTGIGIGICIGIGTNQINLLYRKGHTGKSKTSK